MKCPSCQTERKHYAGLAHHLMFAHGGSHFTCPCGMDFSMTYDDRWHDKLVDHLREHQLNTPEAWKRHTVEAALRRQGGVE